MREKSGEDLSWKRDLTKKCCTSMILSVFRPLSKTSPSKEAAVALLFLIGWSLGGRARHHGVPAWGDFACTVLALCTPSILLLSRRQAWIDNTETLITKLNLTLVRYLDVTNII
uniref:Uncharacterized protein n=1 Tax=Lygus hesperus TaxID=30085 RepID=A0A146LQY9_LYGHE